MMIKKKKTAVKAIVILLVIALVAVGVFLLLRSIGRKVLSDRVNDTLNEIGGSVNVETLTRLNDEWTLPEEYTLEIIEIGDLKMEWLLPEGEKFDQLTQ